MFPSKERIMFTKRILFVAIVFLGVLACPTKAQLPPNYLAPDHPITISLVAAEEVTYVLASDFPAYEIELRLGTGYPSGVVYDDSGDALAVLPDTYTENSDGSYSLKTPLFIINFDAITYFRVKSDVGPTYGTITLISHSFPKAEEEVVVEEVPSDTSPIISPGNGPVFAPVLSGIWSSYPVDQTYINCNSKQISMSGELMVTEINETMIALENKAIGFLKAFGKIGESTYSTNWSEGGVDTSLILEVTGEQGQHANLTVDTKNRSTGCATVVVYDLRYLNSDDTRQNQPEIVSPSQGSTVTLPILIQGTLPSDISFYYFQYRNYIRNGSGSEIVPWQMLGIQRNFPMDIKHRILEVWDITSLPEGDYVLRMIVRYKDGREDSPVWVWFTVARHVGYIPMTTEDGQTWVMNSYVKWLKAKDDMIQELNTFDDIRIHPEEGARMILEELVTAGLGEILGVMGAADVVSGIDKASKILFILRDAATLEQYFILSKSAYNLELATNQWLDAQHWLSYLSYIYDTAT